MKATLALGTAKTLDSWANDVPRPRLPLGSGIVVALAIVDSPCGGHAVGGLFLKLGTQKLQAWDTHWVELTLGKFPAICHFRVLLVVVPPIDAYAAPRPRFLWKAGIKSAAAGGFIEVSGGFADRPCRSMAARKPRNCAITARPRANSKLRFALLVLRRAGRVGVRRVRGDYLPGPIDGTRE